MFVRVNEQVQVDWRGATLTLRGWHKVPRSCLANASGERRSFKCQSYDWLGTSKSGNYWKALTVTETRIWVAKIRPIASSSHHIGKNTTCHNSRAATSAIRIKHLLIQGTNDSANILSTGIKRNSEKWKSKTGAGFGLANRRKLLKVQRTRVGNWTFEGEFRTNSSTFLIRNFNFCWYQAIKTRR